MLIFLTLTGNIHISFHLLLFLLFYCHLLYRKIQILLCVLHKRFLTHRSAQQFSGQIAPVVTIFFVQHCIPQWCIVNRLIQLFMELLYRQRPLGRSLKTTVFYKIHIIVLRHIALVHPSGKFQTELRRLIRELGRTHTVILSSHILSEVKAVCDKALILSQGHLAAVVDLAAEERDLEELFLELTAPEETADKKED